MAFEKCDRIRQESFRDREPVSVIISMLVFGFAKRWDMSKFSRLASLVVIFTKLSGVKSGESDLGWKKMLHQRFLPHSVDWFGHRFLSSSSSLPSSYSKTARRSRIEEQPTQISETTTFCCCRLVYTLSKTQRDGPKIQSQIKE